MLLLEDQSCHSTYTYNEVQKLKLLLLGVELNSQISEITATFKVNKISWKQKKKIQNWYSKELIIGPLCKSKAEAIPNYNHSQNIWDWLQFSCEIVHCGRGLISVLQEFFAIINKISILAGGWALGYHSMKFRLFPDIS